MVSEEYKVYSLADIKQVFYQKKEEYFRNKKEQHELINKYYYENSL